MNQIKNIHNNTSLCISWFQTSIKKPNYLRIVLGVFADKEELESR